MFIYLLYIVFGSYFFFLLVLLAGWMMMPLTKEGVKSELTISVVVAVRNESNNIVSLLQSLLAQEYAHYQVVIVDDHSTDDTVPVIDAFRKNNPSEAHKIVVLKNSGQGKKAAITTGVTAARSEVIVTTDADCVAGAQWLSTISSFFVREQTQLLVGAVRMDADATFFSRLQSIEFSSLVGTSAATLYFGIPTMCNGANLAFRRAAFHEAGGYHDNMHIPSGDDEFLMRKIHQRYPDGVRFMASTRAIVATQPTPTWGAFIDQRIRWAGKWKHNTSLTTKLVALYVFFVQSMFMVSILMAPFIAGGEQILLLLVARLVLEAIFLFSVCRFTRVRWSWPAFLAWQVLYPFYAVSVGITSNFRAYTWKEREHGQFVS